MSAVLYYFTGTGNSLYIAKQLGAETGATLIPITSTTGREWIDCGEDSIGIIFPVQDFKPPEVVARFVKKLLNLQGTYIYAVCTPGLTAGRTLKVLARCIEAQGGALSAGFSVLMPHNGIGSSKFDASSHVRMFAACETRIAEIASAVRARKKGPPETSSLFVSLVLSGLFIRVVPTLAKLLRQVLSGGWASLAFTANETCDGCGICAKICPVGNVSITDGKPVWGKDCAGCFACNQWCPKNAIGLGSSDMNVGHYHHPGISLADMLEQRRDLQ